MTEERRQFGILMDNLKEAILNLNQLQETYSAKTGRRYYLGQSHDIKWEEDE